MISEMIRPGKRRAQGKLTNRFIDDIKPLIESGGGHMQSADHLEIIIIALIAGFFLSLPGLKPLLHWIRRAKADPARILAEKPALPWWARGVVGHVLVFLTLNFWIGISVAALLLLAEIGFGFEVPDGWSRPIRYGVFGGTVGLMITLYQNAIAVTFPPTFNRAEKKALKSLDQYGRDLETAVTEYQRSLGQVYERPTPLAVDGINFRDPKLPQAPLIKISWDQVLSVPYVITNQYIVLYLAPTAPQVLRQLAHGSKPNCYRLYFSDKGPRTSGLKMRALAKYLWAEHYKAVSGGKFIDPVSRKAADVF